LRWCALYPGGKMRMKINGKDKEIKCGSLFELKVESGLGFWII
jgi:hypothetical protein